MHFPFCSIKIDCLSRISVSTANFLNYVSCRAFHDGSWEETYFFCLVDLLPVSKSVPY